MIELSEDWGEAAHQLVKEFDEIGCLLSRITPHTDALQVDFDDFSPEHEWPYQTHAREASGSLIWLPEGKLSREDSTVSIGGMVVHLAFDDGKKVRSGYRFAYGIDNGNRAFHPVSINNSTMYDDPSKKYSEREGIAYWGSVMGRKGGAESLQEYLETIRNSHLMDQVVDLSSSEATA